MLKFSLNALKRRTGRVTARLRGLPHPSRFSKGGDHAPPRFIRHIAARIALVACSHAEAPSSLLRIRILALHHFQLLSTAALAKYPAPAHLVSWKFWSRCGDGTPSWWSATWSCRSISIC